MDESTGSRNTWGGAQPRDQSLGGATTMPPPGAHQPGRRFGSGDVILGRYRVMNELGQGGMGVVYRCFDDVAGVEVALKALPPEVAHNSGEMDEVRENFRLVSKLHHPNIANVNTLERDPSSGDYYLVMECVDGTDLRQWARRRRAEGRSLSLDEVLILAHRIASALDYAHEQKIIHRDIKPSNVRVNFEGEVKVLDFGLAAQLHTSLSRVSRAYHGTSGTGPYMAPEQWKGQRQGAAADQYALAATVYELLCGVPPFENHDTAVLREAVLKQEVLPLENVPPHVNAALVRALAKEPVDRFESCAALMAALSGACDRVKRSRSSKRGPMVWLAACGAAVALAALAGYLRQLDVSGERETTRRFATVSVIREKAQALDRGQGVGLKLDAMEMLWREAEAARENGRWRQAQSGYDSVLASCRALNELNKARRDAEARQRESSQARESADSVNAAAGASEAYQTAQFACTQATETFEKGNFGEAAQAWLRASNAYARANETVMSQRSADYEAAVAKAEDALKRKGWAEALALAKSALTVQKDGTRGREIETVAKFELTADASNMTRKFGDALPQAREVLAFDTNYARAQGVMGLCLLKGEGVAQDESEAVKWFKRAALQGNAASQNNLGSCYTRGTGVEKNDAEAVKWYRLAAEQTNVDAQCALGFCYLIGSGVSKDDAEAVRWFRLAASKTNVIAQLNLAGCYLNGKGVQKNGVEAVKWYRMAAEHSNSQARCNLGYCYETGFGVVKDEAEAVRWYRLAAEQLDVVAQSNLANCYLQGKGVAKNGAEAVRWSRQAAEQKNAAAQRILGLCYESGFGVGKDEVEAAKWYLLAAEQGDVSAQNNLANCFRTGKGVPKDEEEGVRWLRKSVGQSNPVGQRLLGFCYLNGSGVEKNEIEAVRWFRLAAEQGDVIAQNNMGSFCQTGRVGEKDEAEAVKWYRLAAEKGNDKAQNNLGNCLLNGWGVAKDDAEAVKLYRLSAKQGNAFAQSNLGYCYLNGKGVTKDENEAVRWYRLAAEQKNARAQCDIGYCYERGYGVVKDEVEAVKWYRLAAEQMHETAQRNLGCCYLVGRGVAKDKNEAVRWLRKAADQGDKSAIETLNKLR